MPSNWNEDQPIYRQLQDQVSGLILNGTYPEESAVPSVRQVSSDLSINHLTVSKAYQALVDDGLLEKRRGLGMFVIKGARQAILESEKKKFLTTELPQFMSRVKQLDISIEHVISTLNATAEGSQ